MRKIFFVWLTKLVKLDPDPHLIVLDPPHWLKFLQTNNSFGPPKPDTQKNSDPDFLPPFPESPFCIPVRNWQNIRILTRMPLSITPIRIRITSRTMPYMSKTLSYFLFLFDFRFVTARYIIKNGTVSCMLYTVGNVVHSLLKIMRNLTQIRQHNLRGHWEPLRTLTR